MKLKSAKVWLRNRLEQRRSDGDKDRADAVAVGVILSMPLFLACIGFSIDLTKSTYVKNSMTNVAQESVTSSVKIIDVEGDLTDESVKKVVSDYATIIGNNGKNGEISTFTDRGGQCNNVRVPVLGGAEATRKAPYMEITLSQRRGAGSDLNGPTWVSNGGAAPVPTGTNPYVPNGVQYRVITAKVWDASPNFFFGMVGIPCQTTYSEVSAITFGSQ